MYESYNTNERQRKIVEYRMHQPIEELERKAKKAMRRQNIWTCEEIECATIKAIDKKLQLEKLAVE